MTRLSGTIVLSLLLISPLLVGQTRNDFARGFTVEPEGEGPLWELRLPEDVYRSRATCAQSSQGGNMKTLVITVATLVGSTLAVPAAAQNDEDLEEIREVVATMTDGDPGMAAWFSSSYAYAVFPDVGRAGFVVGGTRGDGIAFTAGVSADLAYNGGVAVVTMAKGGLMYEASVGGQKFEYEPYD